MSEVTPEDHKAAFSCMRQLLGDSAERVKKLIWALGPKPVDHAYICETLDQALADERESMRERCAESADEVAVDLQTRFDQGMGLLYRHAAGGARDAARRIRSRAPAPERSTEYGLGKSSLWTTPSDPDAPRPGATVDPTVTAPEIRAAVDAVEWPRGAASPRPFRGPDYLAEDYPHQEPALVDPVREAARLVVSYFRVYPESQAVRSLGPVMAKRIEDLALALEKTETK